MKKLTTPAGIFGPYTSVETLDDRYRCDGGDLPFTVVGEGAVEEWTGPLPPPAPPTEQQYVDAIQGVLDATAAAKGYDNIVSACSYAGAINPFQLEGQAYIAWRGAVWAYCYTLLASVRAGEAQPPTIDELIAALPALVLP